MKRVSILLLILLIIPLLFAAPADAEWADLTGQAAPPFEVGSFLAAPEGETVADLLGRVVLLLLGPPPDATAFNDLRAAWWEDGLRIIAVLPAGTTEPPGGIEYGVAEGGFGAYGEGETSHAVLIDADGEVAWSGQPKEVPEQLLTKLLRKAKTFDLQKLSSDAKPFASLYTKGKLAEAHALAMEVVVDESASEEVRTEATYVANRAEALLAYWKRQAERAEAAGNRFEALTLNELTARHFAGTPDGDAAEAKAKELESDKTMKAEKAAHSGYVRLREDMVKATGNDKKIEAVVKKAEKLVAKYEGTRGAERAARLVNAIKADPAVTGIENFIARERISTSGADWKTRLPKPPRATFLPSRNYYWVLTTSKGTIKLRFFPDVAPMHVSSTIYLTKLGFFDGIVFHRIIPGFMAQGGCPLGTGTGSPGYNYGGEFSPKARHDRGGILSMANAGPGTDGSQFFITFKETPHLDDKHTIFGEVVEGMDTVKKLEAAGTPAGAPKEKITIEKAEIVVE